MPHMYSFRKAIEEDIQAINIISIQSKAYWGYPDAWLERWKDDLTISKPEINELEILIIQKDNVPIGFSALFEDEQNYEIRHLWLKPDYIGKGLGKQLLHETIKEIVRKEKPIFVEADPNAEAFYERMGFKTIGFVESYPKGRFLPIMKKQK